MEKIELSKKLKALARAVDVTVWEWDPITKCVLGNGVGWANAYSLHEAGVKAREQLLKLGAQELDSMLGDLVKFQGMGLLPSSGSGWHTRVGEGLAGWHYRVGQNLSRILLRAKEEKVDRLSTVTFGAYVPGHKFCEVVATVRAGIPGMGNPCWPDSFVDGTPHKVMGLVVTNAKGESVDLSTVQWNEDSVPLGQIALTIYQNPRRQGLVPTDPKKVGAYVHLPVVGTCWAVGAFEAGCPARGISGPPENYDPGEPDMVALQFLADVRPVGVSYDFDDFWGTLSVLGDSYAQKILDDVDGYLLMVYNRERPKPATMGSYMVDPQKE